MGTNYYKLLGVDRNAGDEDIKKAYKKMVCMLYADSVRVCDVRLTSG